MKPLEGFCVFLLPGTRGTLIPGAGDCIPRGRGETVLRPSGILCPLVLIGGLWGKGSCLFTNSETGSGRPLSLASLRTREGGAQVDSSAHRVPSRHIVHLCLPGQIGWPVWPVLAWSHVVFLLCISEHCPWNGRSLLQAVSFRGSPGY